MGKFIDIASELVVANHFIDSVAISYRVVRISPVSVLKLNSVTGDAVGKRIQKLNSFLEVFSVDVNFLFFADNRTQIVKDEKVSFFCVASHENFRLLEVSCIERSFGGLDQK